jgi:CubicO group peptidase (beta-lactamase class C family)
MNQAVRSASAAAAAAHPRDLGLSANGLQRLRQVLLREIDQKRLPGAVATIARQGKLGFLEAFGVQEPAGGARMEIDSIFRIYSMTKPIVSVAMIMLVEEGCVFLADPLAKYVPAFADLRSRSKATEASSLCRRSGRSRSRIFCATRRGSHTSSSVREPYSSCMPRKACRAPIKPTPIRWSDWQGCRCSASLAGNGITAARPMCSGGSSRSYTRVLDMLAAGGTRDGQRLLARKTIDLMRSDHLGPNVRRGSELLQPDHKFGLGFAVRTEPGMSVMPVPSACISGAALPARRSGSIRPTSFTR